MNKFEELHDNITKLKGCVHQANHDLYNAKKEWCTKVIQENFYEFLESFYWYQSPPVAFYIDEVRYKNTTFIEVLQYMSDTSYMNIYVNKSYIFVWTGLNFMLVAINEMYFDDLVDRCKEKSSTFIL